ncbi:DNA cytosine methyltransferase [Chromobacterium haemolyticum]|uniref:DNA cytosine methyltransferase n=1 Tax=Chromobacterium TaxID=535 RepID=UPI004056DFAC
MNELALFAGAGGGILGGHLLGWRTVCAVEWEPYAAAVLAARQNDGILPPFPIWDDVRTFDGRPWRGLVDVVSGGFPCQDISAAGAGAGIDGARSGLWREMARIIGEVRPPDVLMENSPLLVRRGLAVVLGDLAALGYDAQWACISASDLGAPHERDRIWLVAHAKCPERRPELQACNRLAREDGLSQWEESSGRSRACRKVLANANVKPGTGGRNADRSDLREEVADSDSEREQGIISSGPDAQVWRESRERPIGPRGYGFGGWPTEPGLGRVVDELALGMDIFGTNEK